MTRVRIEQADALALPLADRSVDLVVGSPPYCDARTYSIGAQRGCVEWVEWMLKVTTEAQRVSKGPVVWVAAGVTRDRNYWPACEGLMWEWWKRGGDCQLYRPVFWHRVGIPGSGGDDWMRADVEYCMCFKRPGALPWSDNTACGHPPKYGPGGELSYRGKDGGRMNRTKSGYADGKPTYRINTSPMPSIANPGNMLSTGAGGGGALGHPSAHHNEAPYPVAVPAFFIKSLCPPGGVVCDPFGGSGTTGQAAMENGRNAVLFDIRESQVDLMKRRLATVTPLLEGLA